MNQSIIFYTLLILSLIIGIISLLVAIIYKPSNIELKTVKIGENDTFYTLPTARAESMNQFMKSDKNGETIWKNALVTNSTNDVIVNDFVSTGLVAITGDGDQMKNSLSTTLPPTGTYLLPSTLPSDGQVLTGVENNKTTWTEPLTSSVAKGDIIKSFVPMFDIDNINGKVIKNSALITDDIGNITIPGNVIVGTNSSLSGYKLPTTVPTASQVLASGTVNATDTRWLTFGAGTGNVISTVNDPIISQFVSVFDTSNTGGEQITNVDIIMNETTISASESLDITIATANTSGTVGDILVTGGGSDSVHNGGNIICTGGSTINKIGGSVSLLGGTSTGALGTGGDVSITGGMQTNNLNGGDGGDVKIIGGISTNISARTGCIYIGDPTISVPRHVDVVPNNLPFLCLDSILTVEVFIDSCEIGDILRFTNYTTLMNCEKRSLPDQIAAGVAMENSSTSRVLGRVLMAIGGIFPVRVVPSSGLIVGKKLYAATGTTENCKKATPEVNDGYFIGIAMGGITAPNNLETRVACFKPLSS